MNNSREHAGFWRRVGATIADAMWMLGLIVLILPYLKDIDYIDLLRDPESWQLEGVHNIVFNHIIPILITVFCWIKYGATPGKMLFDCEVVDARTYQKITFKQSIIRYAGYYVSIISFCLGFLWIIWDDRKQGLHDKIAKTVVVIHDESTIPLKELENY